MKALLDSAEPYIALGGRLLISVLFVQAGLTKIGAYSGTLAYMQSASVPAGFLPLVILIELGGGIAVIAGIYTRIIALLMAAFCVLTGLLFHAGSSDPLQQIMLMKNVGLAGGFLFLVANGAGRLSVDGFMSRPGRSGYP